MILIIRFHRYVLRYYKPFRYSHTFPKNTLQQFTTSMESGIMEKGPAGAWIQKNLPSPCKRRLFRPSRSMHFGDERPGGENFLGKTFSDRVTGNASAAHNNEAWGLGNTNKDGRSLQMNDRDRGLAYFHQKK